MSNVSQIGIIFKYIEFVSNIISIKIQKSSIK